MKKVLLYTCLTLVLALVPYGVSTALGGAAVNDACNGLSQVGPDGCATNGKQVDNVLKTVVSIISYVVGVIAVIMIMVSGISYMTSAGDAQKITNAKKGLIFAIIGIIIAVAAQVIVNFAVRTGNSTG